MSDTALSRKITLVQDDFSSFGTSRAEAAIEGFLNRRGAKSAKK
jgi:hypothetical protein